MPLDQEAHDLGLRVLDLEVRIEEAETRLRALSDLLDRMVTFLKTAHGEDFPGSLERVEHAAEEALRP
jgi:hypothetical protein